VLADTDRSSAFSRWIRSDRAFPLARKGVPTARNVSRETIHNLTFGLNCNLIGRLSNEKPSAIFRLRGTYNPTTSTSTAHAAFSGPPLAQAATDVTAILGIAIEPLDQIGQALSTQSSAVTAAPAASMDPGTLAEKIVKHMFNYVSGFGGDGGANVSQDTMVPMGVIVKWYENFINKLRSRGAGFLQNEE
jgi:hypothetical protein